MRAETRELLSQRVNDPNEARAATHSSMVRSLRTNDGLGHFRRANGYAEFR